MTTVDMIQESFRNDCPCSSVVCFLCVLILTLHFRVFSALF